MTDSNVHEEVMSIACAGESLLGIVSRPTARESTHDLGVVIVVGGPQYRAGSHRQFVLWARALAAAGVPTLRFDVRGMGDSAGAQREFTALDDDIAAAIEAFTADGRVRRVLLAGLCDGASAALLYLNTRPDPRVHGLMLLNPWVRSDQSLARTVVRHYYLSRLSDRGFWMKLLRGDVARGALREALGRLRALMSARKGKSGPLVASYQSRMAAALAGLKGPALLVLSGEDYTAREFADHAKADATWRQALARPNVRRLDVPGADHTFSDAAHRRQLESASLAWIAEVCMAVRSS